MNAFVKNLIQNLEVGQISRSVGQTGFLLVLYFWVRRNQICGCTRKDSNNFDSLDSIGTVDAAAHGAARPSVRPRMGNFRKTGNMDFSSKLPV